jgi:hypothetical protein
MRCASSAAGTASTVLHDRRIRIERRGEFGERAALDDLQRGLGHIALRQLGEEPRQRDAGGDFVIPRLDRPVDLSNARQGHERQLERHDACADELARDGLERRAGLHVETNGEAGNGKGCSNHHPNATAAAPTTMRAMAAKVARKRDVRDTGMCNRIQGIPADRPRRTGGL